MEISPDITAEHTSLWFSKHKILSFADIHLGYEEELRKKGIHLPTGEFEYQKRLFSKLIGKYKPKTVVLNGDVKHSFGGINDTEWRHTLKLLELITTKSEVVIIKGNHDITLAPIARKKSIAVVDHYTSGELLFIHGDIEPKKEWLKNAKTIVMGHEHPAVGLTNGVRQEVYKCFLKLPWKRKTLIIQPSTFSLTTGIDVLADHLQSKWLGSVAKSEVYVVGEDGKVLDFGRLNRI